MRRHFPILIVLLIVVAGLILLMRKESPSVPANTPNDPAAPIPPGPRLSSLATPPDWSELETFQQVLPRQQFEQDLSRIFALPNSWQDTIAIEDDAVWVKHYNGPDSGESKITFSEQSKEPNTLPPLEQIHIAIDPGHIGGDFAELEQRNFAPFADQENQLPVREGNLTLATAKHLKTLLENLGARVSLVRENDEPVTTQRPEDFLPDFPDRRTAEKLFYRTAEIRARADLVNNTLRPDLVLCLHYNADAWNDPENPWAPRNHFHLLLHGAYMPGEVALDDQRFEMLRHLFTQSTSRALPLARTMSDVFLRETTLVPYHYNPSAPALRVDPVRPIYARNLLANRLYQAPTIFLEPYVMNHRETYDRVQMGDYEGFRSVNGEPRRSLVREYAYTILKSFVEYYTNPPS